MAGVGFKNGVAPVIGKAAVPVIARVLPKPSETTSNYLTWVAKKIVEDSTKKVVKKGMSSNPVIRHEITRSQTDSASWDSVLSFADRDALLLKFAIIDMNKGLWRSWW